MAQCLYTTIRNEAPVACGKCINCKNKRISGWAARLMKEDVHSCMSFFLTFTYDNDNLELCPKGRPTLVPSHLTSYWKILRKHFPNKALKYYACGEYGSNKKRPHYHAILLIKQTHLSPIEVLALIEKTWTYGETFAGTVTGESVAYVLKYLQKTSSVPQYAGDKRTPEFQRSSKGLGADYIKRLKGWHHADLTQRAYIALQGGNRAPMPRYYKDKIYTKEQKLIIGEYMQANTSLPDYNNLKELRKMSNKKVKL